jgi:hypothetical protein
MLLNAQEELKEQKILNIKSISNEYEEYYLFVWDKIF